MNIRRIAAIWAAKAAGAGCKLLGRQGVTWAGKIALKIYPPILQELAAEVRKDIFVVCGTNGKTTTNNMLCAALEEEGNKVICNHTGSNMLNGVVAAFALSAGMNGHIAKSRDINKLSEIFERFSQGENANNPHYQGTGIGLALSKEIVNLHHGIIRAESPEGQGAVFIVELLLGKDHYRPSEVDFYVSDTETAPAATDKKMVIDSEKEPEEELEIDASLPTLLLLSLIHI
mgnify:CR=1 FL=1